MAVNAKDFSAAFFHISSLKNANTRNNTAASKQPNLFWFWGKCICMSSGTTCQIDFFRPEIDFKGFYRAKSVQWVDI